MANPALDSQATAARAPERTRAAEAGDRWARDALTIEMDALADTTAAHLAAHHADVRCPIVGLTGGVWSSRAATDAFSTALRARLPRATTRRPDRTADAAAVLLARGALA